MPARRNHIMAGAYGMMGLVEKIRKILLHPSEFFDDVKSEGIGGAFKYLAVLGLAYILVVLALYFLVPSISPFGALQAYMDYIGMSLTATTGIALALGFYVLILVIPFIGVGVLHLFVKLFGGHGSYADTYNAVVYGNTPTYLLGWIPYVGALATLYSLYLEIKGISKLHDISMLRAVLAVIVVPLVIGVVVSVVMAGIAYMYISSIFTPTQTSGAVVEIDGDATQCTGTAITVYVRNAGTVQTTSDKVTISGTDSKGNAMAAGPCTSTATPLLAGGALVKCTFALTGSSGANTIFATAQAHTAHGLVYCSG